MNVSITSSPTTTATEVITFLLIVSCIRICCADGDVGCDVGFVGVDVGCDVGIENGLVLGCDDGIRVGDEKGCDVGVRVGDDEGCTEGCLDG
jgi:hypothetical protein